MTVFGSSLQRSEVVGDDGTSIGVYQDIVYDKKTGEAESLVVEPTQETPTKDIRFPDDGSNFLIPISDVVSFKNRIVVQH